MTLGRLKWLFILLALTAVSALIWLRGNVFVVEQELAAVKKPLRSQAVTLPGTSDAKFAMAVSEAGAVNVRSLGAKGDGKTDDTAAFQAAVTQAAGSVGKVYIPGGVFLIDALQSVRLRDGVSLLMAPDAVLQAIPNGSKFYAVLTVEDVKNVNITGGTIRGERARHTGTDGEWGTGILITGSQNVTVQGTTVTDCWGDGFYIGTETFTGPDTWSKRFAVPENIRLVNVQADNNRRQGISLIAGKNVEITGARLTRTNGTEPAAGLDIEPNNARDVLENILVVDAYTANNEGAGISVNVSKLKDGTSPVNIRVVNHKDEGSSRGVMIPNDAGIVQGRLVFENPTWSDSKFNGLAILRHDHRSFAITVLQPTVINANRSESKALTTGAAIAIYNFMGLQIPQLGGIGNVSIIRPTISDTGSPPKTLAAFYVWDIPGQEIRSVIISEPVLTGSMSSRPISESIRRFIQ